MNRMIGVIALTGLAGAAAAAQAPALKRSPTGDLSAWVVGWDTDRGLADLAQYAHAFDEISIFAYEFDEGNNLVPEDDAASLPEKVRPLLRPGARLFVTVVNDQRGRSGKQPAVVRDLIGNEPAVKAFVQKLVALSQPYDGVEIDFEALKKLPVDPKLTANFNHFVEAAAQALHQNGKWLAIDIEPDPRNIDWHAIGQAVDEFKVMAYYDHAWGTDPGPLITPATLERILRYAQSQGVPAEKLVIALPTYGFEWSRSGSGAWKAVQLEHADPAALEQQARTDPQRVARDANEHPHFGFRDAAGEHEVWYADERSLARQIQVVGQIGQSLGYPVKNIGFWRLGRGGIRYDTLRSESSSVR